jgi:3-oxoacyl-[acyl-carrier protein] reductase
MLLKNKNAVIYGAGGSIGSTIAKAFAREGATVHLTGRTMEKLDIVAKEIKFDGGCAKTAIVDALNEKQVNEHLDNLAAANVRIDISFNAIAWEDLQGIPLHEMKLADYIRPIQRGMSANFITATAAARHMLKNRSGVILSFNATPAAKAYPLTGGFGPACSALEGFTRNLASELGPEGVRVVGIRSAGSPDSQVFIDYLQKEKALAKAAIENIIGDTMLKKLPLMEEIANVALFLVSDKASAMTGTTVNVTSGTTID